MNEFLIERDKNGFHIFLNITGDYMLTTDTQKKADKIIQALEKQIPMPISDKWERDMNINGECDRCGEIMRSTDAYCRKCGQLTEWD